MDALEAEVVSGRPILGTKPNVGDWRENGLVIIDSGIDFDLQRFYYPWSIREVFEVDEDPFFIFIEEGRAEFRWLEEDDHLWGELGPMWEGLTVGWDLFDEDPFEKLRLFECIRCSPRLYFEEVPEPPESPVTCRARL